MPIDDQPDELDSVTLDSSHLTVEGSKYLLDRTAGEIFAEDGAQPRPRPVTLSAPANAGRLK
jgi:hypothetical protein